MINMDEVFISRLLRFMSDKNKHEIIEYLVDNVCENFEDRFDIFIRALAAEQQFLHANGKNGFEDEIKKLFEILKLDRIMKRCEALMIAKFIGVLMHQFNDKLTKNEIRVIDPDRLIKLCDYIIDGVIWVDTHVAVRRDLVLFEMVHDPLPYEKYKELVFATVCHTTSVYSNGRFGVFHDPLAEACCDLWLEEEDYRVLCQEIFCDE